MIVDTVLYSTKICIRGKLVNAGLAINQGKIVKIAKDINLPPASTKINLNGHIILPGLIDSHVHLRDQQLEYKESFVTGTAAAAAGGVTLAIDMPNNRPVTMDSLTLKERIKLAKNKLLINVAFNSAIPKRLEEIPEIVKAGAIGFKVYLSNNIGGLDIDDDELLCAAFREVAKTGLPVAVHAEDRQLVDARIKENKNSGQNNVGAYIKAHPVEAEVKSIKRVIKLVKKSGVHVHFSHVSSELGLEAILGAKIEGLPLTCEVTPHNLFLSSEQYQNSGFFALTDPPLRTKEDVSVLWNGLKFGSIDLIASDHAPHSFKEKNVSSVWDVKPGVPGLETTLSLLLTRVNEGSLSLTDLVRLTAEVPAKVFGFIKRGILEVGNWADLVVVDMKREYVVDSSTFFSKAKYSPFDGLRVKGKPIKTFVNGRLVMDNGEIVARIGTGDVIGS